MKTNSTVLFIALVSVSLTVFAQNPIVVTVSPAPVSMDTQRSFMVIIPQAVLKDLKKDWLKYLSYGSTDKAIEINGDNLQAGVVNKNISAAPFNVYSKLTATTSGVRLNVWLDGLNVSKEPNNDQHLAVEKYVYDFAVQQYRIVVQKELKNEQAKQKKLENDLASFIKDEEKSVKTVNANVRTTERSNDAITTNNGDIQNSTEKISGQKQNVDRNAADANASNGAKKTLAGLEGEKKNLQKRNEIESRKVDNKNKENRTEARNMETSQENQANTIAALERQKQVVRDVQARLNDIR